MDYSSTRNAHLRNHGNWKAPHRRKFARGSKGLAKEKFDPFLVLMMMQTLSIGFLIKMASNAWLDSDIEESKVEIYPDEGLSQVEIMNLSKSLVCSQGHAKVL